MTDWVHKPWQTGSTFIQAMTDWVHKPWQPGSKFIQAMTDWFHVYTSHDRLVPHSLLQQCSFLACKIIVISNKTPLVPLCHWKVMLAPVRVHRLTLCMLHLHGMNSCIGNGLNKNVTRKNEIQSSCFHIFVKRLILMERNATWSSLLLNMHTNVPSQWHIIIFSFSYHLSQNKGLHYMIFNAF